MDATKLKRLENQNKELEKDVARWRERQELEREVWTSPAPLPQPPADLIPGYTLGVWCNLS